jgi:hypothetical protein
MSRIESGIWFVWLHYAGYAPKAKEYCCTIEACSGNDRKKKNRLSLEAVM